MDLAAAAVISMLVMTGIVVSLRGTGTTTPG